MNAPNHHAREAEAPARELGKPEKAVTTGVHGQITTEAPSRPGGDTFGMTSDDRRAASLVPCAGRPEAAGFGEIRQISPTSRGRHERPAPFIRPR